MKAQPYDMWKISTFAVEVEVGQWMARALTRGWNIPQISKKMFYAGLRCGISFRLLFFDK
jgi:hypothetical protein